MYAMFVVSTAEKVFMYYLVDFVRGKLIVAFTNRELLPFLTLTPERAVYTKMSTVEMVIKHAKGNKCER